MPTNLDVVTVIEPNSSIWPLTPKEFWKWREAFHQLILKEFQVRFRDTYLGFAWVILQPLIVLGIFSVVLYGNTSFSSDQLPYSVYMLSGLVFWTFISNGFIQSSLSLLENRGLIVQTNLKRSLIPLSILSSKLIDLAVGIVFLLVWIACDTRVSLDSSSCLVLVDIFGMLLALIGITFAFSALCIQFKDIRYIIPFLAQVLFFATPILYTVPASPYTWMLYLNPFTTFVLSIRDHLFGTNYVTIQQYMLAYGFVSCLFVIGGVIFRKFERTIADVI